MTKAKYKAFSLIPREDFSVERNILEKIDCELIGGASNEFTTPERIIEKARDADAMIVSSQPVTKEVFQALNKLRIVALVGVGFDTVDTAAATESQVLVTNVPDVITEVVADHTLALVLSLIRYVPSGDRMVKGGLWVSRMGKWAKRVPKLRGSKAGIIGFGRIGKAVATRLQAFGLEIIAYDPYLSADSFERYHSKRANTLEELLKESDIVTVHTFLSKGTTHVIGEKELRVMKKNAFLINTARGIMIDEEALCNALTQGWIAGAALDVLEQEPPDPGNPLLKLDNVIVTPHVAYYSDETVVEQRIRTAEEVRRALQRLPPLNPVNPEVLQRRKQK